MKRTPKKTAKNNTQRQTPRRSPSPGDAFREHAAGALGLMGSAGAVAYATAKAGLHGFTMSVAADYATQNIRANCIIVGSVHTPMVAHLGDEARERRRKMVPMQVEGTAWDIAHGAVYLASDESRWVTGIMLPIDGGLVSLRAWPR